MRRAERHALPVHLARLAHLLAHLAHLALRALLARLGGGGPRRLLGHEPSRLRPPPPVALAALLALLAALAALAPLAALAALAALLARSRIVAILSPPG